MPDINHLVARFSTADLPLVVSEDPIANGDANIFQMDIANRRRRETYRLFRGDPGNLVRVQGTDKKLRQLVLFVREPRRPFEVAHTITRWRTRKQIHERIARAGSTVLRDSRSVVVERQFTEDSKRHYLCGHDERNLFIAQLPRGVSTVRDAHIALRAPEAVSKPAQRQGEWFFIELSTAENALVEHAARRGLLRRYVSLSAALRGNPTPTRNRRRARDAHVHLAEEVVVIATGDAAFRTVTPYARGRVWHIDHKTTHLRGWTRVARNNEPTQQSGGQGIFWID